MKFVITGTGRCGTQYISTLMNKLGITCGHEEIFTTDGPIEDSDKEADASWLAIPYLGSIDKVFLQVRHPYSVISSLLGIGFFDPKVDHGAFRKHADTFFDRVGDPLIDSARWWKLCNEICLDYAMLHWKIETLNSDTIVNMLSLSGIDIDKEVVINTMQKVPNNLNSRRRTALSIAEKKEVRRLVGDLSNLFGYEM